MPRRMLLAGLAALAGCTPVMPDGAPPPRRETPARPAVPTTRLALPGAGAWRDLDCADFPSGAAAQDVLRMDRRDPHHLDADDDGIACEKLPR